METFLEINNLTKKFNGLTAVNNLSFSIEKGKIYGLLGPNGSGKSTTLGMILNVINPTAGNFRWFDGQEDIHTSLKKIGAIIEQPNFYPYMTAVQNLELVCKIKEIPTNNIHNVLKLVGLLERKNSKFKTFSLGMKQRLAIASALLNKPEILILDEPTNGLDPQGIHQIREIILEIANQGTTILMASHLLDEVEKICSHVIIIRKGKEIYSGPAENMSASHGYFELKTKGNPEKLKIALKNNPSFEKITEKKGVITAFLKEPVQADELNQTLFKQGIVLSHLVKRKQSLEKNFLDLTRQKN